MEEIVRAIADWGAAIPGFGLGFIIGVIVGAVATFAAFVFGSVTA